MHFVFLLARIYPYWAIPLVAVLAQIAIFFRRRRHALLYSVVGLMGLLFLGLLAWAFFRGDLHSDEWVRALLGD